MCEFIKICFILIVVGAVAFYAFCLLYRKQTRENYVFFSVVLLFFLVVYCVSVLQYRITGSAIGIEKAIQQINESKEEISRTADNVKLERQKVEEIKTELQKDMNAFRMELKNKNWE